MEPPEILPKSQDRHDPPTSFGDDETLFEGHPAGYPAKPQQFRNPALIFPEPPAHFRPYRRAGGRSFHRRIPFAGLPRTARLPRPTLAVGLLQ